MADYGGSLVIYIYIYIYIFFCREREDEGERDVKEVWRKDQETEKNRAGCLKE